MDNLSIDIVSDLHIDQWDNTIESKHPHGIRAYKPYDFNDSHSDILVIAGDVSDDLDIILYDLGYFSLTRLQNCRIYSSPFK